MTRREDVDREQLNQRIAVYRHRHGHDLGRYHEDLPEDLQERDRDG